MLDSDMYYMSEEELIELNTYEGKTIKPQEEFEFKTTIWSTDLAMDTDTLDALRTSKNFDMTSSKPTMAQIIENRLLNMNIYYSYSTNDMLDKSMNLTYLGNGKISQLNAYEHELGID